MTDENSSENKGLGVQKSFANQKQRVTSIKRP